MSLKSKIIKIVKYRKSNTSLISRLSRIKDTVLEGNNFIAKKCVISGSSLGRCSYIGAGSSIFNTKIGRYCSIAKDVNVIIGSHPSHTFVSTHPLFFSNKNPVLALIGLSFCDDSFYEEYDYVDGTYAVDIGHDVWIGEGVKIMQGVKIGNGVIIAAGAVVANDISDYAIVGGIPAKLIRNRFTSKQIHYLLKIKWWDDSMSKIKQDKNKFLNIETLMS